MTNGAAKLAGVGLVGWLVLSVFGTAAPPPTRGDHDVDVLLVTPSGCYDIVVGAGGVPTMTLSEHRYKQVVVTGVPGPSPAPAPTPTPTPTPVPTPTLTERGKIIRDAAMKVTGDPDRATTAQGLAFLYRETAKQVRIGAVADQAALDSALVLTTDMLLGQQKAAEAWKPFRAVFSTQWTAAKFKGMPECAALLEESAVGLDASAPGAKAPSPEFWAFLAKLIEVLLTLLVKPA